MKKGLLALLALACLLLTGCQYISLPVGEERAAPYLSVAKQVEEAMAGGDFEAARTSFDQNLLDSVTAQTLEDIWLQLQLQYGPYEGTVSSTATWQGGMRTYSLLGFARGNVYLQLVFEDEGVVGGIWFGPDPSSQGQELAAPDDVEETAGVLKVEEGVELPYALTRPKGLQPGEKTPVVVLVHGSGSSDKNESIGAISPFADIAWGLARRGVSCLRYDKRTFVYGAEYTQQQIQDMTVEEEVIRDALAFIQEAGSLEEASCVVLVGHSLGGMLAPRIAGESGDLAGLACLAGSPRQLWEISLDQNLQALGNPQTLPAELEAELEKAKDIQGLDAEDTLFGMGAAYVQDLDLHPAQASLDRLNLPIAIFQGGEDFQVGEKDYAAWEQALQSYAGRSEFHYYPELNHLFVAGTTKEEGLYGYLKPAAVDEALLDDLAAFVLSCEP